MAIISGSIIFDINRDAQKDGNDYGIAEVPVVLQNKSTNERLGVYTDLQGNYTFTDVSLGDYRVILVYGYSGRILSTPAQFQGNAEVGPTPKAELPPYTILRGSYPSGTNHLNAVTQTTVYVSISLIDTTISAGTIFIGPARYEPLYIKLLDACTGVMASNLLTEADNGSFGEIAPGSPPNSGPVDNPYPGLAPGFIFKPQYEPVHDGEYTIGNTIDPYPQFQWWRLSDHTTSIETGLMEIVNGKNPGARFFIAEMNVLENLDYMFSAWIANIDNGNQNPPQFAVMIQGENGEILYEDKLGVQLPTNSVLPIWKEVGVIFNSGSNTNVQINFYDVGPAGPGNDYAIDDVALRGVTIPVFTPHKEISQSNAQLGDIITYTITLTNTCKSSLTNVMFQDILPDGLTFVEGSVTVNGSADRSANLETGFTITNVVGESTTTITFQARVSSIPANTTINNRANIKYDYTPIVGGAPRAYNEQSNVVPLNIHQAMIGGETTPNNSFRKSANKEEVLVGEDITYTIVATNIGNVPANNIEITDSIPNGTSYIANSLTSTVPVTGSPDGVIRLTNPLAPGSSVTITFRVHVNNIPNPNPIPNRASVVYNYTSNPDNPNGATGRGITNTTETKVVETGLSISKSENINYAVVGNVVTYTLIVKNTGNVDYTNVMISDNLASQLTFIPGSVKINESSSDGNIEGGIDIGTLIPNQEVTITFEARVNAVPPSGIIENTANTRYRYTVGDTIKTLTKSSNTVSLNIYNPQIQVSKSSSEQSVLVGDTFKYTIRVSNIGNIEISNVILSDTLPNQLEIINITINGVTVETTQLNGLNIGNLLVNQVKIVVVTVRVLSEGLSNFKNIVTATGSVQPNPSQPATSVTGRGEDPQSISSVTPRTTLSITKSENINVGMIGSIVIYTLVVKNTGLVNYNNIIISDDLVSQLTFIPGSMRINGILSDGNIKDGIDIGTLTPNQEATITFDVRINSSPPGGIIENVANASYSTTINGITYNLDKNSNEVDIIVVNPKIEIIKCSNKEILKVCETFHYKIIVKNTGDTTINNVTLTDNLPRQFRIIEILIDGVKLESTTLQELDIGDLNVGERKIIIVVIQVIYGCINNFINTVTAKGTVFIDSSQPPVVVTAQGKDRCSVSVIGKCSSRIKMCKKADKCVVSKGEVINYTIVVSNEGYADVGTYDSPLTIYDEIPSCTSFICGSLTINNINVSDANLKYGINLGILKPGEIKVIKFSVRVNNRCKNQIVNISRAVYGYRLSNGCTKVVECDSNFVKVSIC